MEQMGQEGGVAADVANSGKHCDCGVWCEAKPSKGHGGAPDQEVLAAALAHTAQGTAPRIARQFRGTREQAPARSVQTLPGEAQEVIGTIT